MRLGEVSSGSFSMRLDAIEGSAVPSLCSEGGSSLKDQWNASYQLFLDCIPRRMRKIFTELSPVVGLSFPSGTRKPCRDEFHGREWVNEEWAWMSCLCKSGQHKFRNPDIVRVIVFRYVHSISQLEYSRSERTGQANVWVFLILVWCTLTVEHGA